MLTHDEDHYRLFTVQMTVRFLQQSAKDRWEVNSRASERSLEYAHPYPRSFRDRTSHLALHVKLVFRLAHSYAVVGLMWVETEMRC
jgi:hypothetical protein